jgi:hypothetical protein
MDIITDTSVGFELVPELGRTVDPTFLATWFDGVKADEWRNNLHLGIGMASDHHDRVLAITLHSVGVEGDNKAFAGVLPGGFSFTSTRSEVRAKFGEPERSGEPGTGIFDSAYPWDRWEIAGGASINVDYVADTEAIRRVQLNAPAEPEPWSEELAIYADYSQFYVSDTGHTTQTDTIWDAADASDRQIGVGDGIVAIGTKRYGTVPVVIEWYPTAPKLVLEGLDRINETGIEITTAMVVANFISADPAPLARITPGKYGLRVLYSFQTQVESDEVGNDRYTVQLWPVDELPPLRYITPEFYR